MWKTRKTKIIATLGPSSSNEKIIKTFIEYGVDLFRLNFSHGSYSDYERDIKLIRSVKQDMPIMADLKGAEIRTIVKNENGIVLKSGKDVELVFDKEKINDENFSVSYDKILQISKKDYHVMADDGNIDLLIREVQNDRLVLSPVEDGILKDRKGTHFIGIDVPFPILTKNDRSDIEFAVSQKVNFIAASMIKSEKEIFAIRGLLPDNIALVAKIEHPEAVRNLDRILDASDMILVARGDLGVEMRITEVPIVQKEIVNAARRKGKPVIIATQLLDSMMHSSRPTRAEVSDIAAAVYDRADALMLTGETAAGKYPSEAVRILIETANNAERSINYESFKNIMEVNRGDSSEAISFAAIDTAYSLKAKAIICFTSSGATSLRAAKFRPGMPIISITPDEDVAKMLSTVFGVMAYTTSFYSNTDEMIDNSKKLLIKEGIAKKGDTFIITAGVPAGVVGNTNMLKVIEID